MNTVRKNRGLRDARASPAAQAGGEAHVRNMARHGYFAHAWSDGTPFGRWIRRFWPGPGYRGWSAGENLYWEGPSTTAERVVAAWMNSPGHRAQHALLVVAALGVGAVASTDRTGEYARVDTAFVVALEFGHRSG